MILLNRISSYCPILCDLLRSGTPKSDSLSSSFPSALTCDLVYALTQSVLTNALSWSYLLYLPFPLVETHLNPLSCLLTMRDDKYSIIKVQHKKSEVHGPSCFCNFWITFLSSQEFYLLETNRIVYIEFRRSACSEGCHYSSRLREKWYVLDVPLLPFQVRF